ncbi:MAG: phosphoribosyltransferase family protein [Nitrososphaerota archaeon]|nr:phosphoribosyltransferase family protein [Candidatus Bathyarchaeota archaeon]MDW8048973.1 phosphoribosyltransferase family protein [Nitrososphaerota archaeon]
MSTHLDELKFRLATVELLRIAKSTKKFTYRELSEKTDLPVTVLSRYVKGHVLPNMERARALWDSLYKLVGLETEFRKRIKFDSEGYFDNTSIIGDINLLRQASSYVLAKFAGKRITKVLTAAVDGVPLATMVANTLAVNLVVAKQSKEVGVPSFLEETYTLAGSGFTVTLYIPRDSIKRRDSVLIVDDVIKSGDTQSALLNLVKKAKAEVSGVFAMIAVGDSWKEILSKTHDCPVEVILRL